MRKIPFDKLKLTNVVSLKNYKCGWKKFFDTFDIYIYTHFISNERNLFRIKSFKITQGEKIFYIFAKLIKFPVYIIKKLSLWK